jgi:hypothetical protein
LLKYTNKKNPYQNTVKLSPDDYAIKGFFLAQKLSITPNIKQQ